MSTTYKNTCPECGKVFDRDINGEPYLRQSAADAAVRMHLNRAHRRTVRVPGQGGQKPRKPKTTKAPEVLHFCPRCGLNLDIAGTALSIAAMHAK